jgi:HK97 family phage prohead protease
MTTETKSLSAPFSLKAVDEGARTFKGLSSTWDEDLGGDMVHPGAFARSIGLMKSGAHRIYLTDGHPEAEGMAGQRATRIIGKVIDAEETKAGVETQFQMVPDDPMAEAAMRRIKGGFVTDLSIVYKSLKAEREKGTGRRHIHELKWVGVGHVLMGMNPGAQADPFSVKAIVEAITADELTDDQKAALMALSAESKAVLRALLDAPADPAPPRELAPADPKRLAIESLLRDLTLRRLATA